MYWNIVDGFLHVGMPCSVAVLRPSVCLINEWKEFIDDKTLPLESTYCIYITSPLQQEVKEYVNLDHYQSLTSDFFIGIFIS